MELHLTLVELKKEKHKMTQPHFQNFNNSTKQKWKKKHKNKCLMKPNEPLVHVDISFFAANVSESPANTFDRGKSEHYLLLPINVRVQDTQNVLEILVCHQRL